MGAIVQPLCPRIGKWVTWLGASVLTVYVAMFFLPVVIGEAFASVPHDLNASIVLILAAVSVILTAWCDVELVREDRKKARSVAKPGRENAAT